MSEATEIQTPSVSHHVLQDMDLVMRAVKGIADVEVGRSAPVAEVRARVLSRYESARACV